MYSFPFSFYRILPEIPSGTDADSSAATVHSNHPPDTKARLSDRKASARDRKMISYRSATSNQQGPAKAYVDQDWYGNSTMAVG